MGTNCQCSRQDCSPKLLCSQPCNRHTVVALILGQILSIFITITGVCSQLLAQRAVDIPTFQSQCNYVLLAAICVPLFVYRRPKGKKLGLNARWWVYPILALADVEANFFVVKAYRYTTISSIVLLSSCLTTPFVMILSRIILQTRYSFWHFVGVLVALAGIALLVFTEIVHTDTPAENVAIGDVLCAASALCYAISNVGQEKLVKSFEVAEFLGMLGLWASLFNGIQVAILERGAIAAVVWTWQVWTLLVGFAVALFLIYILVPQAIKRSSAAVYNLSLLTSNLWALAAGIFLFNFMPSLLYILAFVTVIVGIFIYTRAPSSELVAPVAAVPLYQQHVDEEPPTRSSLNGDTVSVVSSSESEV